MMTIVGVLIVPPLRFSKLPLVVYTTKLLVLSTSSTDRQNSNSTWVRDRRKPGKLAAENNTSWNLSNNGT